MAKASKATKKTVKPTKAKAKPAAKAPAKKAKPAAKKAAPKPAPKMSKPAPSKKTAPIKVVAKTSAKTPKADVVAVFKPTDDRILIERTGAADRTPGGLYIPETVSASDRPTEGRVVAVGRGHRDKKGRMRPLDVQLGDTVMFAAFAGTEVKIGERELMLVREQDLIAIVK